MNLGPCRVDGCTEDAVDTVEIAIPTEAEEFRYDAGLCRVHFAWMTGDVKGVYKVESVSEEMALKMMFRDLDSQASIDPPTITTHLMRCHKCGHVCELSELVFEPREGGARVGLCPACRHQCYVWLDQGTLDLGL